MSAQSSGPRPWTPARVAQRRAPTATIDQAEGYITAWDNNIISVDGTSPIIGLTMGVRSRSNPALTTVA
eukprot:6370352-Pyramimonas_sp.AAC.1